MSIERTPDNTQESGIERLLTRGEIIAELGKYCDTGVITEERSDELGICYLGVEKMGDKEGESVLYFYYRSSITRIYVTYLKDGEPVGGHNISEYDPKVGTWK